MEFKDSKPDNQDSKPREKIVGMVNEITKIVANSFDSFYQSEITRKEAEELIFELIRKRLDMLEIAKKK